MNTVEKLIEFYEMACLNDAALVGREKTAILKARRALRMFEEAMESLNGHSEEDPSLAESILPIEPEALTYFWELQ